MQYNWFLKKIGIGNGKTAYLGKGSYFQVKRVLPNKRDLGKRVTLSGKVLKILRHLVDTKEAKHIRTIMTKYKEALKDAKIPAIDTRMVVTWTKTPGKFRIHFVQPFVPREMMLHNYLKTCPAREALTIFSEMVTITERMQEWSRKNPGAIGIDARTTNYAMINGVPTLVDLYPPIIRGEESVNVNDLIKMRRTDLKRLLLDKVTPKKYRQLTWRGIKERMDPVHQQRHLLEDFSEARPELKSEFAIALERAKAA